MSMCEQYKVFEVLCDSGNDMKLGFLAWRRSQEVDWSFCESLWYTYDFDRGKVICIKASTELGRKSQSDGTVLADHKNT